METHLRLGLVCAMVFCFASLPAATSASGPEVEVFDFVIDDEVMANCGDFKIIANGDGTSRTSVFFDREGNPIRVAFHGRYNGTMTNSATGYSILDAPSIANITLDLVKGTQTNIGAFFTVTIPGQGAILIEAGRIMFDGDGPPIFIAGPHRPPDDTIGILCDALR